ncbi:hypothetical protein ELH42_16865 [Rhizobium ruizarguesonis]|uniref:hypothetical protein n=1 Tax=Rhizobium ruizarguesonis TaxID=2081791 RepID=UPI0010313C90|nr:hypothetical protein [Rhizobium ruizarguesonis]TBB67727.1 hypothetical protein ELH42_16865 [Rhizobium ruizarguesonis]
MLIFLAIASPAVAQNQPNGQNLAEARAEARDEKDLQAQQEMVHYAAAAFWTSVVTGAIGVLTLLGLGWSLSQTERGFRRTLEAEKAARELDQAGIRAYVHIDEVSMGSTGRPLVVCMNTGSTPAKFFAIGADIKKVAYGNLSKNAVLANYEMKAWPALGGNSQLSVNVNPTRGEEILGEYALQGFGPNECLMIVGRIVYVDIFDRKFETGFAFYNRGTSSKKFSRPVNDLPAFRELTTAEWIRICGDPAFQPQSPGAYPSPRGP